MRSNSSCPDMVRVFPLLLAILLTVFLTMSIVDASAMDIEAIPVTNISEHTVEAKNDLKWVTLGNGVIEAVVQE